MTIPKNIGSLSNLQTLSYFIVEEQNGSDLKELEKLNLLRGTIHIKGLGKVIDPTNVATRILKDKKYLEEIDMTFDVGRIYGGSIVESNASVLKALQPNSNLKKLTIREYRGNSFPNWISGRHLPNLVSLTLKNCGLCSHLPPLGQIPSLKKLYISGCHGIKIIGTEFSNNNFKYLEFLSFESMNNWEEWLCIEGFPLLTELSITNCPNLKRVQLPQHLPSLQKLVINDCEMLDVAIPNGDNIIELNLQKCNQVLIDELPSSLKRFVLRGNQYVELSMDHLINNPFLEVLSLNFKDIVECPSLSLCCYNSLEVLSIRGWQSSSLPFSPHLFTKLKYLGTHDCPELECFPMGGFPSNLIELEITNCPKLISSREEWGFLLFESKACISIDNCPSLEHLLEEWGFLED